MTADDFTEAARAEVFRVWWFEEQGTLTDIGDLGVHMAEWARTHLAAQEPTGLDDPETYRKIATEIEWHIRTASDRGYAKAKGTDIPDGVIDAQIESAVRTVTILAARAARRDEEDR